MTQKPGTAEADDAWEHVTPVRASEIVKVGPAGPFRAQAHMADMAEYERRKREFEELRKKVPSTDARLAPTPPAAPGRAGPNETGQAWLLANGRLVIAIAELTEHGTPQAGDFFVWRRDGSEGWVPRRTFLADHRRARPPEPDEDKEAA